MEIKKLTARDYKLKKWAEIIEAKQNSGMKVSEFCESMGISRNSYYYWQRRIRDRILKNLVKKENDISAPNSWIELTSQENSNDCLEIEANGLRISVNHGTDMELLKKVCHMMRSLP